MLTNLKERYVEAIPHMKGGEGQFVLHHILHQENMPGNVTLFADGVLPAGSTVGMHTHTGTMEICCFRSGKGQVKEKSEVYSVSAGDISICFEGECHEILNVGEDNLVYTVLVIRC